MEEAGSAGRATGIKRDQIVAEATSWLGTPYHHQASLKGIGCDCLGLVRGVWRDLHGEEPEAPGGYGRDWVVGEESLRDAARRHLAEIPIADADAGDVLIFRYREGLPARHCGIVHDPDRFIHAWEAAPAVVMTGLDGWWRRHVAHAFRFPGIT